MKKRDDIEKIARNILLGYMQSWGQTAEEKCDALNRGLAAAKIKAKYFIKDNETLINCKTAKEADRAKEFRQKIDRCWRGSFESEVSAIKNVINKYC